MVVDARQRQNAADIEDGRADGQDERGEEADFVEVVGGEFVPRGPPLPPPPRGRVLQLDGGSLVQAVDVVVFAFDRRFAFARCAVGGAAGLAVVMGESLLERPAEAAGLDVSVNDRWWCGWRMCAPGYRCRLRL